VTRRLRAGDAAPADVKRRPARDDTLGMEAIGGPLTRTSGAGVPVQERESAALVELQELPLPALCRRHELLEAELRRAAYWQRLLRARHDLLVAGTVLPDELSVPLEAAAHEGPLEQHLDAEAGACGQHERAQEVTGPGAAGAVTGPGHLLRALVLPAGAEAPSRLAELQDAEVRLAAYARAVAAERALAAQVLTERRGFLLGAGPLRR
jgi:hypothetical protein